MPLLDLPDELLEIIAGHLNSQKDLNSLAQVNHRLYALTNVCLYRYNLQFDHASALTWAAEKNRPETAKHLFHLGVNKKEGWAKRPFDWAALEGNYEMVELFLKEGAHPDTGTLDQTPLCLAMSAKNEELAKLLVRAGADPNLKNIDFGTLIGITPLHMAAYRGYTSVIQLLLERGAKINALDSEYRTPLDHALDKDRGEAFAVLLDHGAALYSNNNDTRFILQDVVVRGGARVLKTLLAKGFDPNLADADGTNPIIVTNLTLTREFRKIGKILLEGGANANHTLPKGQTALMISLYKRNPSLAELLLQFGADPNMAGSNDYTPLHKAAGFGFSRVVECLIDKGARLEARNCNGETPLLRAVSAGHELVVQVLLQRGCDPDTMDMWGTSALEEAKWRRKASIVKLLVDEIERRRLGKRSVSENTG